MLTVGTIVTNAAPFTTPTGIHFRANERFEVVAEGRSTRCEHIGTGSVVWIQGSTIGAKFVTA